MIGSFHGPGGNLVVFGVHFENGEISIKFLKANRKVKSDKRMRKRS